MAVDGLIKGDTDWGIIPCGQACGLIGDIPSCQEVIGRIVGEAEEIFQKIETKLHLQRD